MPAKKAQATKKATSKKATKTASPCICNTHLLHTINPDDPNADGDVAVYGPCGAETMNTFAPGHDAKLKGVLIRCFIEGRPYFVQEGSMLIDTDPMAVANSRGWGHFLRSAHDRAESRRIAREDAKTARDTAKAEAAKAKKATAKKVAAKAKKATAKKVAAKA